MAANKNSNSSDLSGYVVVVRADWQSGAPPKVDLYTVKDAGQLLTVIALLEHGPGTGSDQGPIVPPLPAIERVCFTGAVNIRSGPGSSYADMGDLAAGDIAEILERCRPGDWAQDWGRLGVVYRGGRPRRDLPEGDKWAYLARIQPA
jgi:hypothetical protein